MLAQPPLDGTGDEVLRPVEVFGGAAALARLDGGKGGLGHLGSSKVAGRNARGDLGGGKGIEALRHYSLSPSPKMDGTRK